MIPKGVKPLEIVSSCNKIQTVVRHLEMISRAHEHERCMLLNSYPRPGSSEEEVKPIKLKRERERERLTASQGPLHINEALDPQTGSFVRTRTAHIFEDASTMRAETIQSQLMKST